MAKNKFLDAKTVNLYVKLSVYENRLHKIVEGLKKDLKKKLTAGFLCPANVPILVYLNSFGGQPACDIRQEPDWKEEFRKHLLKVYRGDVNKADAFLQGVADAQPLQHYDAVESTKRLEKKPNETMYDAAKAAETEWEMEVAKLGKVA